MSEPSPLEALFFAALEKPTPEEQAAFLDAACAGDADLRRRVERLLAAHPQVGDFLEPPDPATVKSPAAPDPATASFDGTASFPAPTETTGEVVGGRYELVEKIGEGGMGEVWVARQSEPVKRKVAVKLIRGGMAGRAAVARFEAERQALALMDHPNIARIYDGGLTADGRPYFVMELVAGRPLGEFCDAARLDVRGRLDLFVQVCQAVQHAHQKGVIHRDLKPGNVLVTLVDGRPTPKVIDFGVAKAAGGRLTEQALSTQFGAVVGTLEYMPPEQAGLTSDDVDTRADVYALGVILYELLTGLRPFDGKRLRKAALDEMLRVIREEEPPGLASRLSTDASLASAAAVRGLEPRRLLSLVRGELDWIVRRCLEKDRNRRYETANGLARDVQRYLTGEPVEARPTGPVYRLRKFVARHKARAAVAAVLLLTLVVGAAGTTVGMFRARQAEGETARALEDVRGEQVKTQTALDQVTAERKKTQDALAAQTAARALAEQSDKQARWHLYKARQFPLMDAWRARDFGRLDVLLAESTPAPGEPDFRGWEWYYFRDQCRQAGTPHSGSAAYNGVGAVCRKAGRIAVATTGTAVDVWAPGATAIERTLTVPLGQIKRLAWSPTGDRVACAYTHGPRGPSRARVWAAGGQVMHDFELFGDKDATCFAWHPDGVRIAVGFWSDPDVRVWDVRTERTVQTVATTAGVFALDWHPDGVRLAAGHRGGARGVYDTRTGRTVFTDPKRANNVVARCVRWSPDGKRLAVGHAPECVVYDETGAVVRAFPCGHTQHLEWSPDGKRLLAGADDQTVDLWDVAAGQPVGRYRIHNAPVGAVGWHPDGSTFYSVSAPGGLRSTPARPPAEPTTRFRLDLPRSVTADMAWSPDGRWLACACGNLGRNPVLDARTGQVRHWLRDGANCPALAWSPDSSQIATLAYGGKATIWDANAGTVRRVLGAPNEHNTGIAWSPNGRWLAAGNGLSGTQPVWDTATWEPLPDRPSSKVSSGLAFRPDGRAFVSVGKHGFALVQIEPPKVLFDVREPMSFQRCVCWSPDGTSFAVGHDDGSFHVHRAADGPRLHVARGHTGGLDRICWAPDGRRIATAGGDGAVMIWDAATCDRLVLLPGAGGGIVGLTWSPDGRQLAAAYKDGTIDLWGSPSTPPAPKR